MNELIAALKECKKYFGENDKTVAEHRMYAVIEKALLSIASNEKELSDVVEKAAEEAGRLYANEIAPLIALNKDEIFNHLSEGLSIWDFINDPFIAGAKWSQGNQNAEIKRLRGALENVRAMKLTPEESNAGQYQYALNRTWHIASESLSQQQIKTGETK